MYRFAPVAVLLVMLFCGFGPGEPDEAPKPEKEDERVDTSDTMIDMYTNGNMKVSYWVSVHKDPKVGQYWETAGDAYGMTTTNRWQVTKVEGTQAVVEWQMKIDSEYMVSNYVIGYLVDLEAELPKANVTKAWIGKPGKSTESVEVMEVVDNTGGGEANYETTEEEFTDLELAGEKWSGTLMTFESDGGTYKTWTSESGWFGGILKTESNGTVIAELKKKGDDAKPLLKWDMAELAKLLKKDAAEKPKEEPAKEKKDPGTDGPKKEDKKEGSK
jgi:hypothetical protein